MIIKGEKGLISLFIVPDKESESIEEDFSNDELTGNSFLLESAKVIVVGDNENDVSKLTQTARAAFKF
jgi:hypothetical protein